MTQPLFESAGELLATLFYAAGTTIVTGIGVLAERAGLHNLQVGHETVGLWMAGIGLFALYVGVYQLGVNELLPRLRHAFGPDHDAS